MTTNANQSPSQKAIYDWASAKKIDAVIWTALASNFRSKANKKFTVNDGV